MSERILRIVLDRPSRAYQAGEQVTGSVTVSMERDVTCRGVRLTRFWATHGRGNPDRGAVHESLLFTGPLRAGETYSFPIAFTAPAIPFTYHGHHLNVDHYLKVSLDLAWARDPEVTEELILLPGPGSTAPGEAVEHSSAVAVRRAASLGMAVVGALTLLVGIVSFPFPGVIFTVLGLALFLAGMWRRVAKSKLGQAGFYLSSRVVAPAQAISIRFFFQPERRVRINGVRAEITCTEVCVSGSGTDRTTHRHTVTRNAARISGPVRTRSGERVDVEGTIVVPDNSAYSFKSADNRVEWMLRLVVDIPTWPDWRDERELVVWPVTTDGVVEQGPVAAPEEQVLPGKHRRPIGPLGLPLPDPGWTTPPASESMDEAEGRIAPESSSWLEGERAPEVPPSKPGGEGGDYAERKPAPAAERRHERPSDEPADPLARALARITSSDRFGGQRESLVRGLLGGVFDFQLTVDRVERTFGSGRDPSYRGGRTVMGTVSDSKARVAVRFPESSNDEIDRMKKGSATFVRGEVVDWQRLHDRPVLRSMA